MPNLKKILVTGATSGIGKSLVLEYLRLGHDVIACGRNADKLAELDSQQKGLAGHITLLRFDQLQQHEIAASFASLDKFDIAIFNAGDCEYMDSPEKFDAALFKRVIDINLSSVADLIEHVIPKLNSQQEHAQLILVGSSAAMMPFTRAEAYGASKAGLGYLADSLYIDLHPHNIDVSLVLPGFIKTPLTDKNDFEMPFLMTSDEAAKRIIKGIKQKSRHIAFPKRLIWSLKILSWLPATWWRALMLKSNA